MISERTIGTKPERKVSVMNFSGNSQSFADAPSSSHHPVSDRAPNVTNFIVTLHGAFDHLGDHVLDEDYEDEELDPFQSRRDWSPQDNRGSVLGLF